jgi:2-succinyl-5-enolpyruvyl-6-hydroxy-3-cyclohexene-1-carboxylate synthase
MNTENTMHRYVGAFVDEMVRLGVRDVCVCPGSRSTPLAVMVARNPDIKLWLHLDERSAAFFALGMAKTRRHPVAIVCTSGTAAANFLPAIVEAHYARVPLLVLTADRPPELRDVGAPQTIDQVRLFGTHAKWFADLLLPEGTDDALRYVRTVAGRAAAMALAEPAGPVHLNFPFREPLMPVAGDGLAPDLPASVARSGRPGGRPYVDVTHAPRVPDRATVEALATDLAHIERGLIVCGPGEDAALGDDVANLARSLGYPILADPLSLVRCGPHDRARVVDAYDAFLRDERFVASFAPEVVLRFGAMPTSKPVMLYIQRHADCRQIVVDGAAGWNEPTLLASEFVHADPRAFCQALAERVDRTQANVQLDVNGNGRARSGEWEAAWLRANAASRRVIADYLDGLEEPFEGKVFADLAEVLPDQAILYAGNSMPVRDLDTFFPASDRAIRFLSNRGTNGIDGVVSSALGAAATGSGPVVLVIGDISFYHDLNGLLAAKLHQLDATIVLINNDGGGIFSFLPQAAHPEHFETLFGTPHSLDFRPAIEMYGGRHHQVESSTDFRAALRKAIGASGLNVVEVRTERERNVTLHRRIWPAISAALTRELAVGVPE